MTVTAPLVIERASLSDVPGIVGVLGDDTVGGKGDHWCEERREGYERGFRAIDASPDNELYVAKREDRVLGMIQIVFVPSIARLGSLRCIFESVFVAASARGQGVGAAMLKMAEARAAERGATGVTLKSHRNRLDAHRFYDTNGYERSHVGFSKTLAKG